MTQFVGIVVYYDGSTANDFDGMQLTFRKLWSRPSFEEALADAKSFFDAMKSGENSSDTRHDRNEAVMYCASPEECFAERRPRSGRK